MFARLSIPLKYIDKIKDKEDIQDRNNTSFQWEDLSNRTYDNIVQFTFDDGHYYEQYQDNFTNFVEDGIPFNYYIACSYDDNSSVFFYRPGFESVKHVYVEEYKESSLIKSEDIRELIMNPVMLLAYLEGECYDSPTNKIENWA